MPNPECQMRVGDKVKVVFDEECVECIYIVQSGKCYPCHLSSSCREYAGIGMAESRLLKDKIATRRRENEKRGIIANIKLNKVIGEIVNGKYGTERGNENE